MEVQATKTLDAMEMVKSFTEADLNNNLMEAEKRKVEIMELDTLGIISLVKIGKDNSNQLQTINNTLSLMHSGSKAIEAEFTKLGDGIETVADNTEPQEAEDEMQGGAKNDDKKEEVSSIWDDISAFFGLGLMGIAKSGLKVLAEAILGSFRWAAKLTKGIVWSGPVKILEFIGKFFKPLGRLLESIKKSERIIKFVSKVGNIFKSIGGFFTNILAKIAPGLKVAKGVTRVLGPIGAVITGIMAVFDAIKGWTDAADITGKSDKLLTLGDRAMSSVAALISGITDIFTVPLSWVGIDIDLSPKVIYEKIDGMFTWVKGIFGKVTEFINSAFSGNLDISSILPSLESAKSILNKPIDMIKDTFNYISSFMDKAMSGDLSLDGIQEKISSFVSDLMGAIMSPITAIKDAVVNAFNTMANLSLTDMLPESFKTSWIGKKVVSMLGDAAPTTASGEAKPVANSMNNSDIIKSQEAFNEQRNNNTQVASNQPQRVVVEVPEKQVPVPSRRVRNVDDFGIGFLNSAFAD
jgi:hypothetical protein